MKKVILIILLFLTVNMPNANAYKKAAQFRKDVIMPRWEEVYMDLI